MRLARPGLSHGGVHPQMETFMHGSFDKSGETDSQRSWNIGFFALPLCIAVALIGFVLTHPEASNWISEAAQAEFVGTNPAPELAPTQLARPAMELRTVKVTY
jgi:hypothetical protein